MPLEHILMPLFNSNSKLARVRYLKPWFYAYMEIWEKAELLDPRAFGLEPF